MIDLKSRECAIKWETLCFLAAMVAARCGAGWFGASVCEGVEEGQGVDAIPTLKEILEGYKRFNIWELEEQKRELPELSVEESLTQFFELCNLARALTPNIEQIFLEQDEALWIALRKKLQRAARIMGDASTT
jgi:hypothetical protein